MLLLKKKYSHKNRVISVLKSLSNNFYIEEAKPANIEIKNINTKGINKIIKATFLYL